MAKKKFKMDLGKILTWVAALIALVAFFLMFAPAIGIKDTDTTYTGAQVAFGFSKGESVTIKVLDFSSYFIPYALLIAGLVFSVLSGLGILPKLSKFISAGCYIAAGVLFFLAVQMSMPHASDKLGDFKDDTVAELKKTYVLAAGSIVSGVLAILAGLTAASTIFIKK